MSDDIPPIINPSDEHLKMFLAISNELGRMYHPDVQRDDIYQQIWLTWLEDWRYLHRYVYDEDERKGMALLRRSLWNSAVVFCRNEKAAARGYSPDDLFYFSKASLRELLPFLGDTISFSSLAVAGERTGRSNKPAHEGGDQMAAMADLHRAWPLLKQEQRNLLWDAYVEPIADNVYQALGAALGIEPHAATMRCDRALGALQGLLGGPRPVDRRRVQSNAAAQAQTRSDYGGE